jgi:hypothetical protein
VVPAAAAGAVSRKPVPRARVPGHGRPQDPQTPHPAVTDHGLSRAV